MSEAKSGVWSWSRERPRIFAPLQCGLQFQRGERFQTPHHLHRCELRIFFRHAGAVHPHGAEAERGSAVDLIIEVPVTTIKVPVVEKLSLGRARKTILDSSLTVGKITPSGAGDEQIVIAQSPKAGTEVEQKAAVDLSIEEGKGPVPVPNLKGLRLVEARTALAAVQLTVGKILPPGATEKFIVVSHLPMAETKVDKGTPVDVVTAPAPATPQSPKKSPAKKKPRSKSRKKG